MQHANDRRDADPSSRAGEDGGRRLSRRRFMARGAMALGLGGVAPLAVGRAVLGGAGFQAPSDTLAIAAVGIGGMGQHYLAGCKGERVVALCDLDHYGEWTQACKTGAQTVCPIDFGCEMTEMGLLGALALRMGGGRLLAWDAQAMRVTNDGDANRYLDPPYRTGWSL